MPGFNARNSAAPGVESAIAASPAYPVGDREQSALTGSARQFRSQSIPRVNNASLSNREEKDMAKREQRGNREAKKPKKEKIKVIAAAPSQKTGGWQPSLSSGKKK